MSEAEAEEFLEKVNFEKMNGLVPVVVQDSSNDRVLTQAFMDKQALKLTLTKGRMHYWSRTKKRIWLKGEESGHHSLLQNAILDCDNDAILFKVQQMGFAVTRVKKLASTTRWSLKKSWQSTLGLSKESMRLLLIESKTLRNGRMSLSCTRKGRMQFSKR